MQVLVDDNSRVRKGDVLVELDPEPYRVQVAIKQSAVDVAKANLVLADATVRGLMAQARSQRFKLTHAIEDVDNQIALIRQRVATWEESKASLVLAQQEFDRAKRLLESKVVSKEEYDQKQAALAVATAQVTQALGTVVAEIDGVITRRNVNPGNNVQVGQSLMAIRSLRDIWVDANFKETQLRDLRIGQRAELKVDMYGGQHKFEGRISGFFGVLYANTATLPALLQSLFGYNATTSGLVLSPSGLFAVMGLMVVGTLMSRGVDARYFHGLITMGIGNYWTSQLTLDISPWQVVWPRVVVIAGLSMIFAPLNVAAFLYIPKELRAAAVGLLALLRNKGGSVGTSISKTIHERRDQFHSLRLGEYLDSLNPAVNSFFEQAQSYLLQLTGDPVAARQMALQLLENLRQQQSSPLAYFDTFFVFAVLSIPLVAFVFMMKRSVAKGCAHRGE